MSSYYLCRTECAEKPFYIESIGRNIYSLEELCYYFSQYIYLIDESVMNLSWQFSRNVVIWAGRS